MHGPANPSSSTLPAEDRTSPFKKAADAESGGAAQVAPKDAIASAPAAVAMPRPGYHSFTCSNRVFHVEKRWKLVRELGQGAYGIVVSAQDSVSSETVAIKMVTRVFDKLILAKRALREITLLRHFANHENITGVIDMDAISFDFNEIYLFLEPMEADLHQIIRSGQKLTNAHVQYFLYQILRGVKYIHSANVVHRDIKPGNLLVNADCELKICDFGLSRGFNAHTDDTATQMTEYVATRWYRAPEVMLSFKRYAFSIDVWSIGCVLGELVSGKPVFKGKDYVDQLNLIINTLGTPTERVINKIGSERAREYVRGLPPKAAVSFSKLFPKTDDHGRNLIDAFLRFDPEERITITGALAHPFLQTYHDEADEPTCPKVFNKWERLEALDTTEELRAEIWREVEEFRKEARTVVDEKNEGECESALDMTEAEEGVKVTVESPEQVEQRLNRPPVEGLPPAPAAAPVPFPSHGPPPQAPPSGLPPPDAPHPFPSAVPRDRPRAVSEAPPRSAQQIDPYQMYAGARRASIVGAPALTPQAIGATAGTDVPAEEKSTSYFVPARSRTASASGEALRPALLRQLSTVSINEMGGGAPAPLPGVPLEAVASEAVAEMKEAGKGVVTQADAPASDLPAEFSKMRTKSGRKGKDG